MNMQFTYTHTDTTCSIRISISSNGAFKNIFQSPLFLPMNTINPKPGLEDYHKILACDFFTPR